MYPKHEHSYNSGTVAGTPRAALLIISWLVQLIAHHGQCGCSTEQQHYTVLMRNVFRTRATCLQGVPVKQQTVPRLCAPGRDVQLDRLYIEHFIGGDIMSMSCIGYAAQGTLPGNGPWYNRYLSWTKSRPPLVHTRGGELSTPSEENTTDIVGRGFVPQRVPVILHQPDRVPLLFKLGMTTSLETWNRPVIAHENGSATDQTSWKVAPVQTWHVIQATPGTSQ